MLARKRRQPVVGLPDGFKRYACLQSEEAFDRRRDHSERHAALFKFVDQRLRRRDLSMYLRRKCASGLFVFASGTPGWRPEMGMDVDDIERSGHSAATFLAWRSAMPALTSGTT